jgi:4-alpha-glucanotransferase
MENVMKDQKRRCGVLLHPTSLPGPYGIGELGSEAYAFIDFLERSGQTLWQVLPLGPTGYGDSPYASFSTFAGNPLLISLDRLEAEGWLLKANLSGSPRFSSTKVDYMRVQQWKLPLLQKAATAFLSSKDQQHWSDYKKFLREQDSWINDFALFMAVKEHFQIKAEEDGLEGKTWSNYWDRDIRLREPKAIAHWKSRLSDKVEIQKVLQFWFFQQWLELRAYANGKGIQIIGDIPIFVAADSVDVWANRSFFKLNNEGRPSCVAGVPPDYFSATGQLWGNPIYDWKALKSDHFSWWLARVKAMRTLVDIIRIDHFRGFDAYWEIPAGKTDATVGKWVKAPGMDLFKEIQKRFGDIPILAEDLGLITPGVIQLRDAFNLPGMKILQFAFDSSEAGGASENVFIPHSYPRNCVVYTGSHDNDTVRGWFESAKKGDQKLALAYINRRFAEPLAWAFVRSAVASVADTAIIPAQDLLNMGSGARMNIPSTLGSHNWSWRLKKGQLSNALADKFCRLTKLYGR